MLTVGMAGICQDILGYIEFGILGLCWLSVGCQDILDLDSACCWHTKDMSGNPCLSWDILDLGSCDSGLAVSGVCICQDILDLGFRDCAGCQHAGLCQDICMPGYLGLGSSTLHPVSRAGIYWDSGTSTPRLVNG